MIMLNVSLAIFNLLPFPPLDGSKVLIDVPAGEFQPMFGLLGTIRLFDPDAAGLLGRPRSDNPAVVYARPIFAKHTLVLIYEETIFSGAHRPVNSISAIISGRFGIGSLCRTNTRAFTASSTCTRSRCRRTRKFSVRKRSISPVFILPRASIPRDRPSSSSPTFRNTPN